MDCGRGLLNIICKYRLSLGTFQRHFPLTVLRVGKDAAYIQIVISRFSVQYVHDLVAVFIMIVILISFVSMKVCCITVLITSRLSSIRCIAS